MVHAIHVERLTQQAVAAMASGAQVVVQDVLDNFETALHDDPMSGLDPEMAALRRTLGV